MFTATLVCAPAQGVLDAAFVASVQPAWSGGEIRWLAPGEAAELDLAALPPDAAEVAAALQRSGVDLVLQPAAGRRRRMLIADMDSTMIRQECIDELAAEAGVGDRVAAITARAMNGEIDFEGALAERVALLAGLETAAIARVLDQRIGFMPGGRTLVATMKAAGAHAVLVSGGFTAFAEPIATALGFDEVRANRLIVADGRLTGEVARPILGRDAKAAALSEIAARIGLAPADVLAVGDGANDLGMLALAGTGVALHAKPVVQAEAPHRINHGDLTALLYLQGYRREEFVT